MYVQSFEKSLKGRYVNLKTITPLLENIDKTVQVQKIGKSVEERTIYKISLGSGSIKVLMWSQMHGNESTTTKAVFDLINYLRNGSEEVKEILTKCQLHIIPMLNPDGAEVYTRENANKVDLNRDAQTLSQPESIILRKTFDDICPHFCFNLHDQRTIFSAGNAPLPATISFLAPAADKKHTVTESRKAAMKLIVAMNALLEHVILGQIGRYDDSFNSNCVGDTFQSMGVPTILFEAGHFQYDYDREKTREFIFYALIGALNSISSDTLSQYEHNSYFEIPENQKKFYDVIIKNVHVIGDKEKRISAVGVLYKELLKKGAIKFIPQVEKIGDLSTYYAHKTIALSPSTISIHQKMITPDWVSQILKNNQSF
ncbi:M14 metallopeptidase family protein [Leptobacterium sp. I13]|uniref:M14 family metallopeptidase n=1 Tax=Leptobacterium meishanense TaxID=3128904 RepID=UPI0030EE7C18